MTALTWRKSSKSCEAHCVEVAWRKSSRSLDNGTCVEVAAGHLGAVFVRDSKLSDRSPILSFTPTAWASFVAGIRAGDLRP